ncbi:MAG: hypothetical protein JSW58_06050 [Candidatus Latescibacterota bacterium]|nr:MAG: hypothetical protein JSW58_06050 [Candidatus Latescibacterota bacterium]
MRSSFLLLMTVVLAVLVAQPVLAADPAVTKRVLAETDGTTVLAVDVSVSGKAVYGVTIADESASIVDLIAPKGWVGISLGDAAAFRTGEAPISSGKTVRFMIMTTNASAPLDVTFKGAKIPIGGTKNI